MQLFPNARLGAALLQTAGALALVVTATVACASGPDGASANATDNDRPAASVGQKIMVDPDTGDITEVPSQRAEEQARAGGRADNAASDGSASQAIERSGSGYTAWTTRDGTEMVATDASTATAETVVRCPDGSLRMGHASRSDTDDDVHGAHSSDDSASLCQAR